MKPHILIMGLGNLLMGDEGIGIRCVEYLSEKQFPEGTDLLDGGTAGFRLISLFSEYDHIILIDATAGEGLPGEVDVLRPQFAADFPRSLTSHDIGLKDLVQAVELLGELPDIYLITISVKKADQVIMDLSPELEDSPEKVYRAVQKILAGLPG